MALAFAWLKKGVLLAFADRLEEALQCFRQAAEYSANNNQLAMALTNQGLALNKHAKTGGGSAGLRRDLCPVLPARQPRVGRPRC